jgi:hypothetical protein
MTQETRGIASYHISFLWLPFLVEHYHKMIIYSTNLPCKGFKSNLKIHLQHI